MLPILRKLCGVSSGAQLLVDFRRLLLNFDGDCGRYAAQIEDYRRLVTMQLPDTTTLRLCQIIIGTQAQAERLRDPQQKRLMLQTLDKITDDFNQGMAWEHSWAQLGTGQFQSFHRRDEPDRHHNPHRRRSTGYRKSAPSGTREGEEG